MGKSLKTSQRTIAAVSIASLALLNVGIMAPANAAITSTGGAEDSTTVTEPGSATTMPEAVTLKIHKLTPNNRGDVANAANGTAADKQALTQAGSKPINGVTFTLYKFTDIDLTTNEGWTTANAITKAWNGASIADRNAAIKAGSFKEHTISGAKSSAVTKTQDDNEKGIAKFQVSGDDRGFYVVAESFADDTVDIDGESAKASSITKAAPFVVALPMTDQSTTGEGDQKVANTDKWLGTVNVYPKNSQSNVTKEVEDVDAPGSGNTDGSSDITYTIKGDIPKHLKIEGFDTYKMIDPLDSRLTYKSSTLSAGSTELTEGTHYEVKELDVSTANPKHKNPASNDDGDTIGKYITIIFNETGRQALLDSGADQVEWVLETSLGKTQAGEAGPATIENSAYLIPDNEGGSSWDGETPPDPEDPENPDKPKIPGNPTNTVVSKYGKVTISKVAKGSEDALGGATFQLYTCSLDDQGKPVIDENDRVSVGGVDEWTTASATDADEGKVKGQVAIDGLQLNDFVNGTPANGETLKEAREAALAAARKAGKAVTNTHYCLKETKAPAGYELLPEPVAFQLTEESSKEVITKKIENVPNNGGFDLPLTGGKGIFGLIALGALLVLGSIGYIFFASRRQES